MNDFDVNDNMEFLPPGLMQPITDPTGSNYLAAQEVDLLRSLFPQAYNQLYGSALKPYDTPLPADVVQQMRNLLLGSQGIASPVLPPGTYYHGASSSAGYTAGLQNNVTKKFPATIVPKSWQMRHQSGRGGHVAYLSKTEAAYFTRKASANAFVRAWNQMVSHLGSAAEFDQLRLASILAAVLEAGSGQNGVGNGFRPPLNGQ